MRFAHRPASVAIALLLAAASGSPASAQLSDSPHRSSLFLSLATGPSTEGGLQNNVGIGASTDFLSRRLFAMRGSLTYGRTGAHGGGSPYQLASALLDGVFQPAPSTWIVRPYLLLGVGASMSLARDYSYVVPGAGPVSGTTPRSWWLGPDAGLGFVVGRAFVQYRVGPLSFDGRRRAIDYAPVSLGFRF